MKNFVFALVAIMTLMPALSHAAGPNNSTNFSKVNLEMSCSIARRYLDASGKVATEDLTPTSVQPKKVVISNGTGEMPSVQYEFAVNTPDGVMKVYAHGSALGAMGTWFTTTIFHVLTLEAKDLSIIGFNNPASGKSDDLYYESPSMIMTSVGHTPEGHAINEYSSRCVIKRVN